MKKPVLIALLAGLAVSMGAIAACQNTTANDEATANVGEDSTVAITGISLPGQTARVSADCEAETKQAVKAACAAEAFLATLDKDQQAAAVLPLTQENAVVWSNLPIGIIPRNGIAFSELNEAQLEAAYAVVKVAMGSADNEGYDEAMQILMADDVLAASGGNDMKMGGGPPPDRPDGDGPPSGSPGGLPNGGSTNGGPPPGGFDGNFDYSSGSYFLAFLGTPSATNTWTLQFGGHHLAVNVTYKAGEVVSATPKFTGVEPKVWTVDDAVYAPMNQDRDSMVAMLASLNDEQLAITALPETFRDVLLGPGQDGQFPSEKAGLAVSDLSDEQKALVLNAMKPWVQDADDTTSEELLAIYERELDDTYIAYSTDPTLSSDTAYVRIDGPSVWIEFVCQNGIVYSNQIHYHTIWRDRTRDYGTEFSFSEAL